MRPRSSPPAGAAIAAAPLRNARARRARAALSTRAGVALVAAGLVAVAPEVRSAAPASPSAAEATCIPFVGANRTIRVRAAIGERDSMWLTIDTGAESGVLDSAKAASLGLRVEGTQQSRGSGGYQQGSMAHDVDLRLPGFELLDRTIGTLPLGAIGAHAGMPMEGILGYELFSRRVVEVDYARGCMRLHDPDRYTYGGTGAILPLTFTDNHPYVTARVVLADGRKFDGRFTIDTGSSSALIFSPQTVERERVLQSMPRTIGVTGRGVGGATASRMGRVERLELGRYKLAAPLASLQPPGPGQISAKGTAGNIGGAILNRFTVIFDYARRRMILEPNDTFAEPFEADMSGLTLGAGADFETVRVIRVMEDTPAAEAGVLPGDRIKTVDGRPAETIGLPALREMLRRDGREVKLELDRRGEHLEVTLRTRRLI